MKTLTIELYCNHPLSFDVIFKCLEEKHKLRSIDKEDKINSYVHSLQKYVQVREYNNVSSNEMNKLVDSLDNLKSHKGHILIHNIDYEIIST